MKGGLAVSPSGLAGRMELVRPNGTTQCVTSAVQIKCQADTTGT
jgi:hypothetical protein